MTRLAHSFAVRLPLALPGQRIGLLGGSFNPAHEGHRLISEIAMKQIGLDRVWWLVSPGNPLKDHAGLVPLRQRLDAARRVAGTPHIEVTGFEAAIGSPFTVDTLAFLRRRLPQVQFVWLMGADNLASVHRWKDWRRIFALAPVAVVDRPGWHLKALASPAARAYAGQRHLAVRAVTLPAARPPAWAFLTGPLSAQSSTALRRMQNPASATRRPGK